MLPLTSLPHHRRQCRGPGLAPSLAVEQPVSSSCLRVHMCNMGTVGPTSDGWEDGVSQCMERSVTAPAPGEGHRASCCYSLSLSRCLGVWVSSLTSEVPRTCNPSHPAEWLTWAEMRGWRHTGRAVRVARQTVASVTFVTFCCSHARKAQMQRLSEENDPCFTY